MYRYINIDIVEGPRGYLWVDYVDCKVDSNECNPHRSAGTTMGYPPARQVSPPGGTHQGILNV